MKVESIQAKAEETRKVRWGLLVGIALGSVLTVGAFTIVPDIAKNTKNLICSDWTGFCEDKTSSESVEKTINQGKETITKKTTTTQFQSGKTLWDLLQLSGSLAIPVLLVILGYQLQSRDQKRAEKQAALEREIASANLREEALGIYIDRMSELLLDRNLKNSPDEAPVRDIAITRTLTILRRLGDDGDRKTTIIRFLEEAEVLLIIAKNFSGANLSGAYLDGTQHLSPQQIKSACYWENAVYSETQFKQDLFQWVVKDKKANQQKIEDLKQDKASDPEEPVDCSRWQGSDQ